MEKSSESKLLMVHYDPNNKKYTFFDQSEIKIGSFTISQLMKYIGITRDENFMKDIDMEISGDTIEKFIINKIKDDNLILHDHKISPFMGNIEMLIKLNTDITKFKKNTKSFTKYLDELDQNYNKVANILNRFVYMLIEHTLKVIYMISETLKNDTTRENVKSTLMNYSSQIISNMLSHTNTKIMTQENHINNIRNNMMDLIGVKMEMNKQISDLEDKINSQTKYIQLLTNKLDNLKNDIDHDNKTIDKHDNMSNNIEITKIELKSDVLNRSEKLVNHDILAIPQYHNMQDIKEEEKIIEMVGGSFESSDTIQTSNIIDEVYGIKSIEEESVKQETFDSENGYKSDINSIDNHDAYSISDDEKKYTNKNKMKDLDTQDIIENYSTDQEDMQELTNNKS